LLSFGFSEIYFPEAGAIVAAAVHVVPVMNMPGPAPDKKTKIHLITSAFSLPLKKNQ